MSTLDDLHALPAFRHFSALQLQQLSECVEEKRYAAGETILGSGDPTSAMALLRSGGVKIWTMTSFGPFDLLTLKAGDFFGELGFFDGKDSAEIADALADSSVAWIDAVALRTQMEQHPRFELAMLWSLWKGLSHKLRLANARLEQLFTEEPGVAKQHHVDTEPEASEPIYGMAHKVDLFREQRLSNLEIKFLASLSQEERFQPGQRIFNEGEIGDKMYIVADGTVMICKTIPGVGEEALAFLKRGDYFGEMGLIENRPRSADARAHPKTGTVVLALPREVVESLLNIEKISSARLLKILTRMVAERLRDQLEKLSGLFLLAGGDLNSSPPGG